MRHKRKIAITVLGIGVGALGVAQAVSGETRRSSAPSADPAPYAAQAPGATDTTSDDTDEQARGSDAERAGRAAVDAVGGGRVSSVEREDESGVAWEVEVLQPDGSQVEVDLDRNLGRVAIDRDDDSAKDDDAGEARSDSDND
jgi:hypothetical protein